MLRERNEFHGNDFSGADLIDVNFRGGIDLDQQTLPTGPGYLYLPDATASIDEALTRLPDRVPAELVADVEFFLRDTLRHTIATGQQQLLQREKTYERCKQLPAYITAAFALLRETLPR